jgi:hypothetical protein
VPYRRSLWILLLFLITVAACHRDVSDSPDIPPRPACSDPANRAEALWCATIPPDSATDLPAITAALARMRTRDTTCSRLANTVLQMLLRGRVHLFDREQHASAGGLAPIGLGAGSWLLLSRDVLRSPMLQQVLAHEADHIRGEEHSDSAGSFTVHALQCGQL